MLNRHTYTFENDPAEILLVEDDLSYAYLLQEKINRTGRHAFQTRHVQTLAEATNVLQSRNFSLILLDLNLPDGQGMAILAQIYQVAPDTPIVILSGNDDEQLALTAVKTGAQDYLIKDQITNEDQALVRALQYAIERQNLRLAVSQQSQELQLQKETAESTLDSLEPQTVVLDYDGVIIQVNKSWRRFAAENQAPVQNGYLGINYFDICRQAISDALPEMAECLAGLMAVRNGTLPRFNFEYPCHSPIEQRWFMMQAVPLQSEKGGLVVSHINITETKKVQLKLDEIYKTLDVRTHDYHISLSQDAQDEQPLEEGTTALSNQDTRLQLQVAYRNLVTDYVRAVRTREDRPKTKVQDLAQVFATHQFLARDVVTIHLDVLEMMAQPMNTHQERLLANDARLVLLELMGHLMDKYAMKVRESTA